MDIKPYCEDPGIIANVPLNGTITTSSSPSLTAAAPSRYESQKRRDWNTFNQYLMTHRPPLSLSHCSGAHVLEFMRYLDQFGKTKVHGPACPFFGQPNPPAPCPCPLKQAWGSLDALVGRLRAAFEENGGMPEANPFGARAVRIYLKDVRDHQSKARGVCYDKKKKIKRNKPVAVAVAVGGTTTTTNPNHQEAISATVTAHDDMLLEGLEVPNLSFGGKDSSGFKA